MGIKFKRILSLYFSRLIERGCLYEQKYTVKKTLSEISHLILIKARYFESSQELTKKLLIADCLQNNVN